VDVGGTLGDSGKALTLGSGVAGTQATNSVGNLTLNASAQVAGITIKSNTSNTTSAGNIGLLSIASGRTLTASGFTAGLIAASQDTNTALATGSAGTGGTLMINGNATIGVAGSTSNAANVSVNLSGLAAFIINSTGGTLNVGSALNSRATFTLAGNANSINVATLAVGNTSSNYNLADLSTLSLGAGSNTVQAGNIILGQGKGIGRMIFSGASGSVTITGLNGSGTSNITVGNHSTATHSGGGTSSLSLAGHDASVSAGTVTIGQKSGSAGSGASSASLTFDTGAFTADTIQMAVVSAGASLLTSTFTVGGPTANSAATGVVTIGGNLLLAATTGGSAAPAGTLTINGGTVNVNSTTPTPDEGIFDTSTVGTSTTTLTLAGGTLDLNGGTIGGTVGTGRRNITNLHFRSGTLRNVFQINDGSGLTKTTAGTLILSGVNSYTGSTTISSGTLLLGGSNSLPDSTPVSIGTAALDAATFADTTGTLDVTAAATIHLGPGASLAFSSSSGIGGGIWAGTLSITGSFVSGSSIRFGSSGTALTNAQLLKISAPGFFNFRLDADGYLIATPGSGYSSWAFHNGGGVDVSGDHDNDGVQNGVEYFLGGATGNTTGVTSLPGVVDTLGLLSVTWTKAAGFTGTYGTDFVVEASSTLWGPWTPQLVSPAAGFTVTISGNDVKYTFPPGRQNFARLKVIP
jgi:autotransporter-associated beta strand protein